MKKLILFFATAAILAASCTNNAELRTLQGRIDHIENRQQLKALVDTFSVLADVKDTDTQGLLFTEDGVMKTMQNGVEVFRVNGRENIVKACADYLALFETVYHSNGQQTVELIDAQNAKGISYCYVVLIGKNPQTGKTERLTEGFRYHDTYTKKSGKWQISIRESEVLWAKTETVN
ncbi:MAG: nuclear transport factor 2 family protein [Bacteroidales bacterium]|nr:nuclear transport factor 2 family protein [Bacteroidales bacterium]